jgi:DNA polymerase III subunit gamma/tau
LELISVEDKFSELAHQFEAETLYRYIDILSKTQQEMRFSHHTKIYLETALIKMTQEPNLKGSSQSVSATNPLLEEKVTTLENLVRQLTAQLQTGVMTSAPQQQAEQAKPRAKTSNGFSAPVGRIKEVLKDATKEDIQRIKMAWAKALSQLAKSQSALLADAEPVAASPSAFVLKFKYDIHCQMVAENKALIMQFTQALSADLGILYEMLCIPDGAWTTVRETFIRERNANGTNDASEQAENEPVEQPFIDDEKQLPSEDPLIVEAEKMFGKDFVEVIDE